MTIILVLAPALEFRFWGWQGPGTGISYATAAAAVRAHEQSTRGINAVFSPTRTLRPLVLSVYPDQKVYPPADYVVNPHFLMKGKLRVIGMKKYIYIATAVISNSSTCINSTRT